jgi:hypothetical protein
MNTGFEEIGEAIHALVDAQQRMHEQNMELARLDIAWRREAMSDMIGILGTSLGLFVVITVFENTIGPRVRRWFSKH